MPLNDVSRSVPDGCCTHGRRFGTRCWKCVVTFWPVTVRAAVKKRP